MEKKLSVIMAFVCDPYLAILQKRLYKKFWEKEIDELIINVNGRNDKIRNFIIDLWKDEPKVKHIDSIAKEIRQGLAFNRIYPFTTGDIIMTMDSDNFIYKPGVISFFRQVMDRHDACGSFGYHAQPDAMAKLIVRKFGTVRLNPFMSFWKKDILSQFNRIEFGTYKFKKGDILEPYGEMPMDGWLDVMGKMSLDYFGKTNNFIRIPPTREKEYVHVGGVSSIFRSVFRSLEDTNNQKYKVHDTPSHNIYYFSSCHFIYEVTKNECPFKDFNAEYERGFKEMMIKEGKDEKDVIKGSNDLMGSYRNRFL